MRKRPFERAETDIQVVEAVRSQRGNCERGTMAQDLKIAWKKPEELREGFKSIISAEK